MHSRLVSFLPAIAGALLVHARAVAQDAPLSQMHPSTFLSIGLGFGQQDVEVNTGSLATGVVSRSADAFQFRLRGEHFFESDFGFFANVYFGNADDIDEDLGATDSSYDTFGFFLAASYRARMGDNFRLPVRFGPFMQMSEQDNSQFTDGAIERTTVGVRLSAEPEVVLSRRVSDGKVSELSVFGEFSCGAGPADVEDDVDSEEAYAFTLSYEIGARYRFASGLLVGLSWIGQKYHVGTTESYNNTAFFGVDDDFTGVLITAGWRF
jgi:hypothetical protein